MVEYEEQRKSGIKRKSENRTTKKKEELSFHEYHYISFSKIREKSKVTDSIISSSFSVDENQNVFEREINKKQAGRSGKQIIFTYDKKFILKEVDQMEKQYLLNIAEEYSEYLSDNESTLLARIYGLFSVRLRRGEEKMYFMIMQNLDSFPKGSVIFKYDLKFSEFNR